MSANDIRVLARQKMAEFWTPERVQRFAHETPRKFWPEIIAAQARLLMIEHGVDPCYTEVFLESIVDVWILITSENTQWTQ